MTLDSFEKELKELKVYIEHKIKHTYLDKYINKPTIDHCKLFILYSIMNETTLDEHTKKKYIVSTMLVQIALDTHDRVPIANESHEENTDKKSKQLLVLAGDYYSGLYYLLLAEIDDFKMIQTLATAIKEVNELKMKLYYNEVESFNDFIDLMKQIESLLIIRVMEWLTNLNIKPFIEDILITHKLMTEKQLMCNDGLSQAFDGWLTQNNFVSVLNHVETSIQKHTSQIEQYLLQPSMNRSLKALHLDNLFSELIYDHTSFVEEG
ncbi:MAG TPA: heptaprenyl diphosphate synthase component 1 [Virgibacillus sp.]|nr:heptaprenyl diphosphate synthase component 1 [Virgibacillus sp.]